MKNIFKKAVAFIIVSGIDKNAKEMLSHHLDTDTPVGANSHVALSPKFDGNVLQDDCWLIPAKEMWKVGREKLLENEEYFVEPY